MSSREDFREKCQAAGIGDDKPLSLVLETVFDAAMTAKDAVQDGARGLTQEGEADLIKRIARHADVSMRDAAAKHRLRLERKSSLIAGSVVVACLVLGGGGGYWWGWSNGARASKVVEHEVAAAALQSGPEAAAAWAKLIRSNDLPQALAQCSGAAVWSAGGRQACAVPLWIDGPGMSPANRK